MTGDPGPLEFDERSGLIPAIVQDAMSGRVLMLGYMNAEALARTRETGRVTFYSRSRGSLWTKGETSGNWLELIELRADCDADALLITARPHGPTCHTGAESCFGTPQTPIAGVVLGALSALIGDRKRERPNDSYTTRLLEGGKPAIVRKVGEESLELCIEVLTGGPNVDAEAADLVYHLLVLLAACDLDLQDVARTLQSRAPQHRPGR